jgi:hypothetical protein
VKETEEKIKIGCRGDVDIEKNIRKVNSLFIHDPLAEGRRSNGSDRRISLKEFPPQCFKLLLTSPRLGECGTGKDI